MKDIILYAIPVFILSVTAEVFYFRLQQKHHDHYRTKDTASSLSMGVGNVITGLFSKAIVFGALVLVYQYRLFGFDRGVW